MDMLKIVWDVLAGIGLITVMVILLYLISEMRVKMKMGVKIKYDDRKRDKKKCVECGKEYLGISEDDICEVCLVKIRKHLKKRNGGGSK